MVPAPTVVHLVRAANGLDPYRRFLDSYLRCSADIQHELVLLFKGFDSAQARRPYLELADGLYSELVAVGDEGFDLTAYLEVVRRVTRDSYCFLNSFSVIEADGWLWRLTEALARPDVGIVGATGSWSSGKAITLYFLGLPSRYGSVFTDRAHTLAAWRELPDAHALPRQPFARLRARISNVSRPLVYLPDFPSPHVRTNAFAMRYQTLTALKLDPAMRSKFDTHVAENGRTSITRQIKRMGLRALVVGRDGRCFEEEEWDTSDTFAQADQQNLLVADNQTRTYELGDRARRELLSRFAWGDRARPTMPAGPRSARPAASPGIDHSPQR